MTPRTSSRFASGGHIPRVPPPASKTEPAPPPQPGFRGGHIPPPREPSGDALIVEVTKLRSELREVFRLVGALVVLFGGQVEITDAELGRADTRTLFSVRSDDDEGWRIGVMDR